MTRVQENKLSNESVNDNYFMDTMHLDYDAFLRKGKPRPRKKEKCCQGCFSPYELIDCELIQTCNCLPCIKCGFYNCGGNH